MKIHDKNKSVNQNTVNIDIRFGIDKVEFITKKEISLVREDILSIRPLKEEIGIITPKIITTDKNDNLHYKDAGLYKDGYRTVIILTSITTELFILLHKNNIRLGKPLLVEIFKDTFCRNEKEAIEKTDEEINTSYLLYQHPWTFVYYRNNLEKQTARRKSTNDLYKLYINQKAPTTFGDRTLYLGKGNFVYVIYARLSKTDNTPVIHREFRLKGRNIARLLKINKKGSSYFESLINLQSSDIEKIYKSIEKKHIKIAKLNELKLGKYHLGLSRAGEPSPKERKKIKSYVKLLKKSYKLYTTSDFMRYFRENGLDYSLFLE